MTVAARNQLARLLAGSDAPGSFSIQVLAPHAGVAVTVKGVGQIKLPGRFTQVRELSAVASPARFGLGEQTLTDTTIRDTWEIPPHLVTISGPAWPALLEDVLAEVGKEFGLAPGRRLTAEFHSMLMYRPGQFFLPHQDSEKNDAMIGTLVMSLPSAHTGGELVVEHGGESVTYQASRDALSFTAFYADCRHEVRRLVSGTRVTLTFNLLVTDDQETVPAGPADRLATCLAEHFSTPVPARYVHGAQDPPDRLVYLLDHEYTQRGLSWNRLKGADAERAGLLRAAAGLTGCDAVLALAEIRETWNAEEPWDGGRAYGRGSWDDGYDDEDEDEYDEDEDEYDEDEYVLTDLIDSEISLGWWTKPSGKGGEPISLRPGSSEVCASTPCEDLKPYQSEYEGYMGNYGNTMDRWYRRAAVVIWPRERELPARGEASPSWALDELGRRIQAGDLAGARAGAMALIRFWRIVVPGNPQPLLTPALAVAAGLDDPEAAGPLLQPFRIESLASEHAAPLIALATAYGEAWVGGLIDGWFAPRQSWAYIPEETRLGWIESPPELYTALVSAGAPGIARYLLTATWHELAAKMREALSDPRHAERRERLERLGKPLASLLGAAAVAGDTAIRDDILGSLKSSGDEVLICLLAVLRATGSPDVAGQRAHGLDLIAADTARRLASVAARPARAADDWSISLPPGCTCELCRTLQFFLEAPDRRSFNWPLAKEGRRHVHTRIDNAELPVSHVTRRTGSPYTLTLTKTGELFERDRQEREQAAADLAWLTSQGREGGTHSARTS